MDTPHYYDYSTFPKVRIIVLVGTREFYGDRWLKINQKSNKNDF